MITSTVVSRLLSLSLSLSICLWTCFSFFHLYFFYYSHGHLMWPLRMAVIVTITIYLFLNLLFLFSFVFLLLFTWPLDVPPSHGSDCIENQNTWFLIWFYFFLLYSDLYSCFSLVTTPWGAKLQTVTLKVSKYPVMSVVAIRLPLHLQIWFALKIADLWCPNICSHDLQLEYLLVPQTHQFLGQEHHFLRAYNSSNFCYKVVHVSHQWYVSKHCHRPTIEWTHELVDEVPCTDLSSYPHAF
jgi:hypothetical protein